MPRERNENIQALKVIFYPVLGLFICAVIISKLFDIPFFNSIENWTGLNLSWSISWWVIPIIVEWTGSLSWENQTWSLIKTGNIIPDDPRGFVDYIMKYWELNKDYFSADVYNQPVTHWDTREENNALFFPYIWKYRYQFPISKDKKNWYILITLKKVLAKNRDIFLAINWSSVWLLVKKNSEIVRDENEYLYPINKIPVIGNKWRYIINLFDRVENETLTLWWFTSESGNWIKNITIVFK